MCVCVPGSVCVRDLIKIRSILHKQRTFLRMNNYVIPVEDSSEESARSMCLAADIVESRSKVFCRLIAAPRKTKI